jgi:hypothetical protein
MTSCKGKYLTSSIRYNLFMSLHSSVHCENFCRWEKLPVLYELRSFIILFTEPSFNFILNQSNPVHTLTHSFPLEYLLTLSYHLHWDLHIYSFPPGFSTIFMRVRKIAKSEYWLRHVRPSVGLSKCNNSALTGSIFMKFDIPVFHENLSRKFKFR